jgi:hypothetical protein
MIVSRSQPMAGMYRRLAFVCFTLLAAALLGLDSRAAAQGRGGGMHGGGPDGAMGGFPQRMEANREGARSSSAGTNDQNRSRGGLQLGPPGRWWDDSQFAKTLGLDSRQQQRMDEVFGANKNNLIKLYKNLQHEESQLEKTTRMRNPDEAQIFQQIDRVTAARGELEKANAHMLLEIRKEMTPDQVSRLDAHLE